jgi:hypothetical protein
MTSDTIVQLGKQGMKDVLVVPISFVSEHSETLLRTRHPVQEDCGRRGNYQFPPWFRHSTVIPFSSARLQTSQKEHCRKACKETSMKSGPDVVVIGAGITGLTCAYRLQKMGHDVLVLESSNRAGGVIRTEKIQGHLVEWGAGSLLPTHHTFEILAELGLLDDLIEANPKSPRYVVVNEK